MRQVTSDLFTPVDFFFRYFGKDKAFAFIMPGKSHSPKAIEFNTAQTDAIIQATREFVSVVRTMQAHTVVGSDNRSDPLLDCLTNISEAIRLDVILTYIPLHAKRLIVVPHGILCSVPFPALPCNMKKELELRSVQTPTYLLDRFPLGVVCIHSLNLLQWCEDRGTNLRFAPILQGVALNKQNASNQSESSDGKGYLRLESEYSSLRKALGRLAIEHQVNLVS